MFKLVVMAHQNDPHESGDGCYRTASQWRLQREVGELDSYANAALTTTNRLRGTDRL